MNITIYGFKGTAEELLQLLQKGVYVEEIKTNKSSFGVTFREKSHSNAGIKTSKFKENYEEMYNACRNGESYTSIADRFKCSHPYVIKIVNKLEQNRKDELEEIYNDYRAGKSFTSIGEKFCCSPIYVKKLIKKMSKEKNFKN